MIIAVVFFIVAYIIIPLLTNNEVLSGPNVRSKLFSLIGGLIIAVYLSILRLIESSELSRYFTLLILGIILLILPILRIWQLKYDFSGSDGYVDYDGPPWIPEGADPIINPLLLIPGYHPDYLEGVEGSAIFRNIAIVLMMIAAISVIMSSFVLVRKQLREGIPINDEDGRLLDSQYDITLIHHKISTKINNVLSIDMDKHTQNIQKGYSALLLPFEHVLYGIQRILYNLSRSKTKTEPSSPKLKGVAPLDSLLSLVIYILYLVVPFTQYLFGIVMTILSLGLYRKKGKGRVSLNKIISHMGTIVLISLIFIFLSLDGFHGLGNLFGQPGLYIAFFIAIHFIYLSADPLLRQRLSKTKLAYVFVLPTIAILLFELYFPILVALYLSFQDIRQYPFSNYDELITTSNVGFDNYKFIVDKNLAAIVFIFVITAIVVAKVLNSLNNETNTRRRLLGKFFTIAIWISTLYWTITLNFAVNYENYIEQEVSIFISPSPLPVFINTIKWTLVCVTFHMIIGTTLGMLMNTKFKGRGIVRALMIIPWAVPNFITISIFSAFIFDNDSGFVNIVLKMLHLNDFAWMASENILFTAILVNIWLGYPFIMVSVLASLQSIPEDLYEAASIDGASQWQNFRHITLPMIKPTLYVVSLLGFLWTFNLFNVIFLLTLDKASVLAVRDYYILIVYIFAVFRGGNWSVAASLSFLLFLLVAAFSFVYTKLVGKGPYELGESSDEDKGDEDE